MSIFAVLQGTADTDRETTQSALAMARQLNRPLTGLLALPDPQSALMVVTTPESAGVSAAATRSLLDLQKDMLVAAESAFRSVVGAGAAGIDTAFMHQVGTAETVSANAATLADAIVFPRSAARSGEPLSGPFDHVMMDERLAVVLAGTRVYAPGPVVIGWDGSNGAARAVRLHVPLIMAVSEVIIAQNQKDAERDGARPGGAPGSLEQWLANRGVRCRSEGLEGDVAEGLLALAARTGAGLIVAGAYGHSRLGERLFGGTSRSLLVADEAPALALAR